MKNAMAAIFTSLLLTSAFAAETRPAKPEPGPKNDIGLTATLIANKDTYTLDPAQSGKQFRDSLDTKPNELRPAKLPAPPKVDLTLRITNTTDKPLTISLGGDDSAIDLVLEGNGSLNKPNNGPMTMEFRMGTPVKIAAGKSHDIPVKSLASGKRGISTYSYWTESGDYTLTATLTYASDDDKQVTVTSGPAKIKVEAAK